MIMVSLGMYWNVMTTQIALKQETIKEIFHLMKQNMFQCTI